MRTIELSLNDPIKPPPSPNSCPTPKLPKNWKLKIREGLGGPETVATDHQGYIWLPIDGKWKLSVPYFDIYGNAIVLHETGLKEHPIDSKYIHIGKRKIKEKQYYH